MDSDNLFLLQIEKYDDINEADSYIMQVYEIKGDDKEVVEDPLLLKEIMDNIQCMSGEDLTESMTSIEKKEDDEQDFENDIDYYNADTEDASNNNQIYNQNLDSTDDDELDLNTAEEVYNKLNDTQKKIVDFAIQKVVKNSNIPLYNEDVFGVSYVDDTDIWSDEIKKEEIVCGNEYADLVKLARSLASSERKRMLRKQKRAFKMPCEVCGKMISQANMNIHMTVHTGEKKFACTKCPAKFKTARGLSAHTNAHLGRRPFQCDQCPKAYTSDTALRAHKMDHQERIHKCDVCGQAFTRKYSLTEHVRIHEENKIFTCNICDKVFLKLSKFKAHNRKHQGLPSDYPCSICFKRFSKISCMKVHMQKIHNISIVTRKMFFNNLPSMKTVTIEMPNYL